MQVDELIALCNEKIDNPIADGVVSLVVPGPAYGESKKLLGIRGAIVCEYGNSCLCAFDAGKLLKAIEKKKRQEEGQ